MSKIKLIILDWAGTTIDFGSVAPVQAFIDSFEQFGIYPTIEEVRKPMGMRKIDHIKTMLQMPRIKNDWAKLYNRKPTNEDASKIFQVFEEKLFQVLGQHAEVKEGVIHCVEQFKKMGLKIGSTTGYTDEMMAVLLPIVKEQGYEPDYWVSADATNGKGRPYPYMIFRNMEHFGIINVKEVLKIGDTISDIEEGKNAGVISTGVIIGSSEMGLTREEFLLLSKEQQKEKCEETRRKYELAGADYIFEQLEDAVDFLNKWSTDKSCIEDGTIKR